MFDLVRKHTKVMMSLMFLLIIPAFVLVGVDGFSRITAKGDAVATVAMKTLAKPRMLHIKTRWIAYGPRHPM